MRAIICPLRTRVPRSTACSTSRPGTLTPSTTVSSAARAPVEVTMRGTRSSTAWKTLTGRGGAAAAGLSVDADAEEDAVDWPVQPAAASTTASSANQGRGIRQMIPQKTPPPRSGGHGDRLATASPWVPDRRVRRRSPWHLAWPSVRHVLRYSQMDEETLRGKARTVVQNGKLPGRTPDRTWGGPGVGAPCTICELQVRSTEMEFEIQFARDGGTPAAGLDKYHVHIRCFAAWAFERQSA